MTGLWLFWFGMKLLLCWRHTILKAKLFYIEKCEKPFFVSSKNLTLESWWKRSAVTFFENFIPGKGPRKKSIDKVPLQLVMHTSAIYSCILLFTSVACVCGGGGGGNYCCGGGRGGGSSHGSYPVQPKPWAAGECSAPENQVVVQCFL